MLRVKMELPHHNTNRLGSSISPHKTEQYKILFLFFDRSNLFEASPGKYADVFPLQFFVSR